MKRVNKFDGTIYCRKDADNNLHFYWKNTGDNFYLFTQSFSKGVYNFFKDGVRDFTLLAYKDWNRNPRLDKTVDKIPMYLSYIVRNVA